MTEGKTRGVFCNRTLNLRSIRAIGYDMDYTLIHYFAEKWEQRAYDYLKEHFQALGWPVGDLKFDSNLVCRGLIIDTKFGNLVKANRFGFVKKAMHGLRVLNHNEQRENYTQTIVDLSNPRWVFLNTFFSLSEGCLFAQIIDLLDQKKLPGILHYQHLYETIRKALDWAHMEGVLKSEIIRTPDQFVDLDPEIAPTLLDQKYAGKKLLLITNSDYSFTAHMMGSTFDRFLPKGMSWRDVFDLTVVSARKPTFFTTSNPAYEIVSEDGLMRPYNGKLKLGKVYSGGSASVVEDALDCEGDEILYVGDHMFGDVRVSKNTLRWRTGLILRELEDEIEALEKFADHEKKLNVLMQEKEALEQNYTRVKVLLSRKKNQVEKSDDLGLPAAITKFSTEALTAEVESYRAKLEALDHEISPIAQESGQLSNSTWGLMMRSGNDKSFLAFQMERYADIYMSRVSNLLRTTPYAYMRSRRGNLPHD